MHFYKFHVGDYLSSTSHLTEAEDLAYRRLLDMYYTSEAPIPADLERVSRRLRMPQEVIESVLRDFFTLSDEGWRQSRCDATILAYQGKSGANKANGKRGGRPKKPTENPVGFDSVSGNNRTGTQQEPNGNPDESEPKGNHKPLTTNHEPLTTKEEETPATDARMCPPDWQPSRELAAYACGVLKELALNKEILHFRAYKWRRPVQDWDDAWRRWVQQAAKSGSYAKQEWH